MSLEEERTAKEAPAMWSGSKRFRGFISNIEVFHILMAGPGWQEMVQTANGGTK